MTNEKDKGGENPHEKPDEKGELTIIVNGSEKIAPEREISYEALVSLAFGDEALKNPATVFLITYESKSQSGILTKGKTVAVEKGMKFDVDRTTKS